MAWQITIEDLQGGPKTRFTSDKEEVRIGRDPHWNDLFLDATEVSRRHALLSEKDGELYLEDLQSKNGSTILYGKEWMRVSGRLKLKLPVAINLGKRFLLQVDYVSSDETKTFHTQKRQEAAAPHPPPDRERTQEPGEETLLARATAARTPPPVARAAALPDPPTRAMLMPVAVEPPTVAGGMMPEAATIAAPPPLSDSHPPGGTRLMADPVQAAAPAERGSPFAPLVEGAMLERYQILGLLGQGSFGITYLAEDVKLKRQVAVKEFFPKGLAVRRGGALVGPEHPERQSEFRGGLEKFLLEGRLLAQVIHPNLVQVHNYFEANGTAYLVMAYERGRGLDTLIRPNKRLREEDILQVILPLLGALEVVHEGGLIHRDIKPGNIFIRQKGGPVLLDFGAARAAVGERSRLLTSIFTPGYAPFEQYSTDMRQQGPWTDLYAMGAVCYRLMSGQTPVDSQTRASSQMAGQADPLLPLGRLAGESYSLKLVQAVEWAMALNRQKRPQKVAQWRVALPGGGPGQ